MSLHASHGAIDSRPPPTLLGSTPRLRCNGKLRTLCRSLARSKLGSILDGQMIQEKRSTPLPRHPGGSSFLVSSGIGAGGNTISSGDGCSRDTRVGRYCSLPQSQAQPAASSVDPQQILWMSSF